VTERDPQVVSARRALLDALDALGPHRDAVILVGAQAIYLHTGSAEVADVPPTPPSAPQSHPAHFLAQYPPGVLGYDSYLYPVGVQKQEDS
jgi:hypothetical protein